jgi:hypothetical protein
MLEVFEGVAADDAHRAEVAHVERHRVTATRSVFRHRPTGIEQRHFPAAEDHHLRSERDVFRVQG